MALIISEGQPLNTFETVMKSAWGNCNNDGVGIYWRDASDGKRHLARFKESKDLAKIPNDYDRMLVHFRKSTKGEGTHPFICRCRPDLKSEQWLLTHNGCVSDEAARASLAKAVEKEGLKAHIFNTLIDSEPFAHVWGELEETDLLERAKRFTVTCTELGLDGWANLIFYNVVTDEYVIFVDSAIHIVQSKKQNIIVFCSDSQWLDSKSSKKLGVTDDDMTKGTVIYGKSNDFKTKKKIWLVKEKDNQTHFWPQDAINNSVKGDTMKGGLYSGSEAYDSDWGSPAAGAYIDDHVFVPSKYMDDNLGEKYCNECYQPREFHLQLSKSAPTKDVWNPSLPPPAQTEEIFTGVGRIIKAKIPKSDGQILLVVPNGDSCRPQKSDPWDATGICQRHFEQGFRGFYYDAKEKTWYLVKSLYYKGDNEVAHDSGLPKE